MLGRGIRIAAYEIVDALGAGDMGEVYRALDPTLDRFVAIKILPPASRRIWIASCAFSAKLKCWPQSTARLIARLDGFARRRQPRRRRVVMR